jgi:Domain of unknown function (DUF4400)
MSQQQEFETNGYIASFFQPFRLLLSLFIMLITLWLLSIGLIYGMSVLQWNNQVAPAQAVLEESAREVFVPGGLRIVKDNAISIVVGASSVLSKILGITDIAMNSPILSTLSQGFQAAPLALSMVIATKLMLLKILLLASMLPVVLLGYALGWIDGLTTRSIRRDLVEGERSGLYHRAKFGFASVCSLILLSYTAIPVVPPVSLNVIGLAWAGLGFVLANIQWSHFKKYR